MDGGGSPRDKSRQLALANALQGLVYLRTVTLGGAGKIVEKKQTHLSRIHLSLNDVQYGNVARRFAAPIRGRDHHVLGLKKPAHDVENRGLLDAGGLGINGEGSVAGHKKMKAGRGDERSHCRNMRRIMAMHDGRHTKTDQIVVHVTGVAQRGRARCHDGRH